MMVKQAYVVALVLGMGGMTGCDKLAEAVAAQAQSAATDAAQAGMSEDDKLGDKLNGYIDCINNTSRRVRDAEDRYLDWVDPKTGPTGKESNVYGIFEISDPTTCTDGIKKSAELEPRDAEMEAAAQEFLAALTEVVPIVNEAYKYYEQEDFKDDKFAKGKDLHPKLGAAFEKFRKADDKFRVMVIGQNEALQERELARIEKEEGKNLIFQNKFVMSKAKKLVEASEVKTLKDLDLAKYETVLGEYEKAVDEMQKYVGEHKAEVDSVTTFSMFVDQADAMRKAAKDLMRRRRDKPEYTKDELDSLARGSHHSVEGNPDAVVNAYNDLVSRSNSLSWHWYKQDGT